MPTSAPPAPTTTPELLDLSRRLQGFARSPGEDARWHDDQQRMGAALDALRRRWGERLAERSGPRLHRALLAFRIAPQTLDWRDLRLACRGLHRHADWEQRRLLDDPRLLATLLAQVEALGKGTPRWRGCVRALLAARQEIPAEPASAQLTRLDLWLYAALAALRADGKAPRWAQVEFFSTKNQ